LKKKEETKPKGVKNTRGGWSEGEEKTSEKNRGQGRTYHSISSVQHREKGKQLDNGRRVVSSPEERGTGDGGQEGSNSRSEAKQKRNRTGRRKDMGKK
jgi:hypothetical protein